MSTGIIISLLFDITPLQQLIELRKSLKMPIWDYNDKFHLKINDVKVKELPGDHAFQKDVPYIMDITFRKYDFQKDGEQITGYSISEIKKDLLSYYIYIERNGIVRISFKAIFIFIALQSIM